MKLSLRLGLLAVLWIECFGCFSPGAAAQAPSFSCRAITSPVESTICATPSLAIADQNLANAYKAAQSVAGVDHDTLKAEQLDWLRQRDRQCRPSDPAHPLGDKKFLTCLETSYQQRTIELKAGLTETAPCTVFADILKSMTNVSIPAMQSMADTAAGVPGAAIALDHLKGTTYTLKSKYVGSLACQQPHLFHETDGQMKEVRVPAQFAPAEGSHCGDDRVRLVSINNVPGLLDEIGLGGDALMERLIAISLIKGGQWSHECWVHVILRPTYHVAVASCAGKNCAKLSSLAEQYSNANHGLLGKQGLPTTEDLSSDQQITYGKMLQIAGQENLASSYEVPFFGSSKSEIYASVDSGCSISFDGLGGSFFPVVLDRELLLGKIGHDGFGLGLHSGGPNDAIAIYQATSNGLQPIAGFCVLAGAQSIVSVDTTYLPAWARSTQQ